MATDALTNLTAAIAQGLGAATGSMRPAIEQLFGDRNRGVPAWVPHVRTTLRADA